MKYVFAYLVIINAVGFLIMLIDKQKAQKNLWRIPEKSLIKTAIIGGSIGILLGMYLLRHKTRKPKFTIGIPIILAVQILLGVYTLSMM